MSKITPEELNEAVLDFNQRRKRSLTLKKYSRKIAKARERSRMKMADSDHLMARAHKAATVIVRKIVAGKLGMEYNTLSVGQKIEVDRKVERLSGLAARLAPRLLPRIRQNEIARLKTYHASIGAVNEDILEETIKVDHILLKLKDLRTKKAEHDKEGHHDDDLVTRIKDLENVLHILQSHMNESHGAGFEGTTKLMNKYRNETPGENVMSEDFKKVTSTKMVTFPSIFPIGNWEVFDDKDMIKLFGPQNYSYPMGKKLWYLSYNGKEFTVEENTQIARMQVFSKKEDGREIVAAIVAKFEKEIPDRFALAQKKANSFTIPGFKRKTSMLESIKRMI